MGMETMTKPDWAERKAQRYLVNGFDKERCARLLRAERRRAVRKCRKVKTDNDHNIEGYDEPYNLACDDCAKAIQGGGK